MWLALMHGGWALQVEKVLSSNVFHRPAAVLALQVIGAGKTLAPLASLVQPISYHEPSSLDSKLCQGSCMSGP